MRLKTLPKGLGFYKLWQSPKRAACGKPAVKRPEPKLTRVAFKVSPLVEFCSASCRTRPVFRFATTAGQSQHLTLRRVWFGCEFINVKATNPNWEKWPPAPTRGAQGNALKAILAMGYVLDRLSRTNEGTLDCGLNQA
jgi:hypothetical protein